ncbi:unnamed protein product [Withania somnifera]
MFFDEYGYHGRSFEQSYRCYPASFIDKPQLENGDKIIMLPSALDHLFTLIIQLLFDLRNASTKRVSHCGVLEFIAEEGMIYMPYCLERTVRNFSCLTTGDSIMVAYNNKKYYIDIVETKPSNGISIVETDCVVFAPPLVYKEPERTAPSCPSKAPAEVQEAAAEVELNFNPFYGEARRLDGNSDKQADVANGGKKSSAAAPSSQTSSCQSQGRLVFGTNANRAPEKRKEPVKEEPQKKEQPKFQLFSGKRYSLRG